MRCLDPLFPALERHGIRILRYDELDAPTRMHFKRISTSGSFPILTPLAVDRGHPFPYISNLSLSLAVEMEEPTPEGDVRRFARVKVPIGAIPRFIRVDSAPEGQHWFVKLEDMIAHNLDALFPGMLVKKSYCFRVTRDADFELQEDEADDLLRAIESELRKRRFGEPVRLEVEAGMPEHLIEKLLEALSLERNDCYEIAGMLGTNDLWTIVGLDLPQLHDPPFTPSIPARLIGERDIFRGDSRRRHPAAASVSVVRSGRAARQSRGPRSQGARDQTDLVPHVGQLAGGAGADRRGRRRQTSRSADRAQSALRRREQHPLGA